MKKRPFSLRYLGHYEILEPLGTGRFAVLALLILCWGVSFATAQSPVTRPSISEEISPVEELSAETHDGQVAIGVLRRPPGQGPFPAVVIISSPAASEARDGVVGEMSRLKIRALTNPTFTRFLAAGYVTVLAQQGLPGDAPPLGDPQLAIVDHVKSMSAVDPNSAVVYGVSYGGYLALKVAAENEVAAVAAEEPPLWSGYDGLIAGLNDMLDVARVGQRLLEDPRQFLTPEIRRSAQEELRKISGPIFLAVGGLNQRQEVFVDIHNEFLIPDLKAAGKEVESVIYPGQPHAFGWYGGLGPTPSEGKEEAARKFFADMHAFFSRHLLTQPEPVDDSRVQYVPVCDALQRRIGRC